MAAAERERGRAAVGRGGLDRFRYEYGAQPLHLLATLFGLALIGYALLRITEIPGSTRILLWLLAAAVLHDLVALPVYSVLLRVSRGGATRAFRDRATAVAALNHVRVPAGLALLLLVAYLPLNLRIDPEAYLGTTGRSVDPFLGRWLLISAALFLISAVAFAMRLRRGLPEPAARVERIERESDDAGAGLLWSAGAGLSVGAALLAIAWVAAAVVVGLVTNGFGG